MILAMLSHSRPSQCISTSVTPGTPSLEVQSAGPHSLLLSVRRNQSMECFDTPFEIVNMLEFASEWDHQTVSTRTDPVK